jgi:hypothetical protein
MPREPMKPDLWKQVKPAIDAVRQVGHAWLEQNANPPRHKISVFTTNEFDWPSVVDSEGLPWITGEGPVNWRELVGMHKGRWTSIGSEDVPELVALVSFVGNRDDLRSKMSTIGRFDGNAKDRIYLEMGVCDFVTSIIDRAEVLGTTSDDAILDLYCDIEKSRFAPELATQILVPICLTRLELTETLEIGPGVRIEPMDERTQRARAVSVIFTNRVPAHLVAAATHAIVVDDIKIANPYPLAREYMLEASDDGIEMSSVELVLQSIHIVSERPTGYAQVCVRPSDWADSWRLDLPVVASVRTTRRFPPEFAEQRWRKTGLAIPADQVAAIPSVYTGLLAAPSNVKLAARRSLSATMRQEDEDVTLDACIGIEALLGNEKDELTHRMAQRAAAALASGSSPRDPTLIYGLVKKVYEHRSAIVHGSSRQLRPILLGDKTVTASSLAPALLRMLLLSWVEFQWTPASLDADLLNGVKPSSATDG